VTRADHDSPRSTRATSRRAAIIAPSALSRCASLRERAATAGYPRSNEGSELKIVRTSPASNARTGTMGFAVRMVPRRAVAPIAAAAISRACRMAMAGKPAAARERSGRAAADHVPSLATGSTSNASSLPLGSGSPARNRRTINRLACRSEGLKATRMEERFSISSGTVDAAIGAADAGWGRADIGVGRGGADEICTGRGTDMRFAVNGGLGESLGLGFGRGGGKEDGSVAAGCRGRGVGPVCTGTSASGFDRDGGGVDGVQIGGSEARGTGVCGGFGGCIDGASAAGFAAGLVPSASAGGGEVSQAGILGLGGRIKVAFSVFEWDVAGLMIGCAGRRAGEGSALVNSAAARASARALG
jgi:hypothetical protein